MTPPVPRFFNTLARAEEPLPVAPGQRVSLYTCGPTVYNYAHIGNFRAYVFEDLLQRFLETLGHPVDRVMNFTDVDDKTIRGAAAEALPLREFTQRYKDAFVADLETLRIQRPGRMPEATAHVDDMVAMIRTLVDKGAAYQAEDGSVYFRIAAFPNYGRLARLDLTQLRPGARVAQDEYEKETAGDFALWKARSDADGDVYWDSPWGPGRPGWHIECSAMAGQCLGETIDIHCGGEDNIFPHHEAEIAQSECVTGHPFVKLWMHCAHLLVDGRKMSKSLGNCYTLRDLTNRGFSGRALRLALISVHYRLPLNFTFKSVEDATRSLERFDAWVQRLHDRAGQTPAPAPAPLAQQFMDALAEDLNISKALACVWDALHESNRALDDDSLAPAGAAALLAAWRLVNRILVLDAPAADVPADIAELVDARQAARAAKDWKRSDEIRDALAAKGWRVKDTPKGPELLPITPAS